MERRVPDEGASTRRATTSCSAAAAADASAVLVIILGIREGVNPAYSDGRLPDVRELRKKLIIRDELITHDRRLAHQHVERRACRECMRPRLRQTGSYRRHARTCLASRDCFRRLSSTRSSESRLSCSSRRVSRRRRRRQGRRRRRHQGGGRCIHRPL